MAKQAVLKAKLSLDTSAFTRGIRTAEAAAKSMAKGGLEMAKRGIRDIELVSLAASAALLYGIKRAYDLGHEMQEMSEKTGIAVDQLMILNRAAKDHGIDDISTSVKKMQVNIVEAIKNGTGPAAQAFEALGLSAYDLVNKAPIDQFKTIANAVDGIKNSTVKSSVAVAIFGREGERMLSLFANKGALDAAAKSVGRQAQVLKENAERFSEVSIRLSHVGEKMEGFFVGIAANILPLVEAATARLEGLDLEGQGEKFGEGIRIGVQFLTGAFNDPRTLVEGLIDYLKAGMLEVANLMSNGMNASALYFASLMIDEIDDVRAALQAGLEFTFQESIEFFTGGWKKLIIGIGESLMAQFHLAVTWFQDAMKAAATLSFKGGEEKEGGFRDKARSIIENVNFGQHETFESMFKHAKEGSELSKMAQTVRDTAAQIAKTDTFGAQKYLDAANAAMEKLRLAGKHVTDGFEDLKPLPGAAKSWAATMSGALQTGILSSGSNALGGEAFKSIFASKGQSPSGEDPYSLAWRTYGGALSRGAYAQTPIMHIAERRAFENTLVAQGIRHADSRSSGHGGYHVVRSGDFRRARNVALEREREAQKNQAKNIANIADNTADMASAWGGKGTGAAGS